MEASEDGVQDRLKYWKLVRPVPMVKRSLFIFLVVSILSFGSFAQDQETKKSPTYPELFQTIWQTVNDKFFDPGFVGVNWNDVRTRYASKAAAAKNDVEFAKVMREMLAELPVSHLTLELPRQQGSVGIGVRTKLVEGKHVVVSVSPASDAQLKGVRVGDVMLNQSDEQGVLGTIASLRLKGCDGRERQVTVRRESHLQSERPSIRWRSFSTKPGERIGYIRAVRFDDDVASAVDAAMDELGRTSALIIDARDNGGGNLSFIRLTSYFSSGEHLVAALITRPFLEASSQVPKQIDPTKLPRVDRAYKDELIFRALIKHKGAAAFYSEDLGEKKYKGKVVILINEETESAGEGFAWHAKLKTDATLIGRRTAGQLLGAEYFRLPGDWRLGVATQSGWGPDGKPVIDQPVSPHIEMRWTLRDVCEGTDPDMTKALEILSSTK